MMEQVVCLLVLECFCCLNNGIQDTVGALPGGYPMCQPGCGDYMDISAITKREMLYITLGKTILYFPDLTQHWPPKTKDIIETNVEKNDTTLNFVHTEVEPEDFKKLKRFNRFLTSNGLTPQLSSLSHHRSKRALLPVQPEDKAIVLPDTTSDITFVCDTGGSYPVVEWHGYTGTMSPPYKISHNGDIEGTTPFGKYTVANSYDITIVDATKDDAGRYVCSSISETDDLAVAYLTVIEPQPCGPSVVVVTEGDTVALDCSLNYYGAQSTEAPYVPEIVWYYQTTNVTTGVTATGTETSNPDPFNSVDGSVTSTYTFTAETSMDMTYFYCKSFLEGDEASPVLPEQDLCTIELDVTALPVKADPGPVDTYVLLDGVSPTSVELDCNVDSNEFGFVTWIGNTARLLASGDSRISVNEIIVADTAAGEPTFGIKTGTTFTLTIDDITKEDAGKYDCQDFFTSNSFGEADVVVLKPTTCPVEVLTVVPGGDDFTVECSIEFFGTGDVSQEPIVTIELDGVEETGVIDTSTANLKKISVTKSASTAVNGQFYTCNVAQDLLGLNQTELCSVTIDLLVDPTPCNRLYYTGNAQLEGSYIRLPDDVAGRPAYVHSTKPTQKLKFDDTNTRWIIADDFFPGDFAYVEDDAAQPGLITHVWYEKPDVFGTVYEQQPASKVECQEYDECADANDNNCDNNAVCTDTRTGYNCSCPVGFTDVNGDGTRCDDINECLGAHDCHEFADCTNTEGSYQCTCKSGFVGNGRECTGTSTISYCRNDSN